MDRVTKVAALLDLRYGNPQVAAINRKNEARTARSKNFWHSVVSKLHRPYRCQAWLRSEMEAWDDIRRAQKLLKGFA